MNGQMNDQVITVRELRDFVEAFIDAREWVQFHSPKSLSMSIAVEASELMEKFLWCDNAKSYKEAIDNKQEVEEELADVIITAICFARSADIDIVQAVENKMKINDKRYPVEKAKGICTKHDKL